jgi:hypothetical protein
MAFGRLRWSAVLRTFKSSDGHRATPQRPGGPSVTQSNDGSSKCCRTKQPAVVRLLENRNCRFEFIPLRHAVRSRADSIDWCAKRRRFLSVSRRQTEPEKSRSALLLAPFTMRCLWLHAKGCSGNASIGAYTLTDSTPSAVAARATRIAISPRFAISAPLNKR